jgi:hypothetical protein
MGWRNREPEDEQNRARRPRKKRALDGKGSLDTDEPPERVTFRLPHLEV